MRTPLSCLTYYVYTIALLNEKVKCFFEKIQKLLTKQGKRFRPIVLIHPLLYQKSEIFQRFLPGKFLLFYKENH